VLPRPLMTGLLRGGEEGTEAGGSVPSGEAQPELRQCRWGQHMTDNEGSVQIFRHYLILVFTVRCVHHVQERRRGL
jgi:hypothetical protein